ncbi:unnamed protein product [Rotaria sordida]|uniref:Uncharacterized protein n=1 Tax=Rotaria sordida TaxID=392033 RepID=A0A820H858_9BILA|nr:unnamed protein product [Rotaria sordida]
MAKNRPPNCPALKLMANMIGHTGYYPCFYYYTKDKHVREVSKRQYQYEISVNCRTVEPFYSDSREAQLNSKNVFGHLGTSILDEIVDVSLPYALIIDYAHVSLLRHFRDIIKTVAFSLAPAVREKIDVFLRAQQVCEFHGPLSSINTFA